MSNWIFGGQESVMLLILVVLIGFSPRKVRLTLPTRSWTTTPTCFTQRVNLWKTDAGMKELLFASAPTIARLAGELAGTEGIRLWHDQALIKEPWANATSWHLDGPYWSFDSTKALSLWMALDDATYMNGCMYFLKGSHKSIEQMYLERGNFEEIPIGKNMGDVFKAYPEATKCESVPALMKAGSCSFHSSLLVHAAGPNMTNARRRAFTMQFMPLNSTFNGKQNILTNEQLQKLKIGQLLEDESINPLLWRRS
eukprot:TRINITY_DN3350_c0_g1_i1.p1 TRINITY_DN3350_c0_g1~~TRINITY_DN3350_c0_g1_i1.p1  ORF type:complete len:254 (-),score=38.89 TRINITY_DN3350_c0_g1_i1:123-884(-)